MLVRLILVLAAVVAFTSSCGTSQVSMESADQQCCEFVKASIAVQKELAGKVKRLNGRRVYMFDATGFSRDFVEEKTVDNIRYKSGVLADTLVDVVLSMAAQRTLAGAPGAQTFYGWADKVAELTVDQYGVYT